MHEATGLPGAITKADASSIPHQAIQLAAEILKASQERETAKDRASLARIAAMIDDPAGKQFTLDMVDQVLRIKRPSRAALCLESLIDQYGFPRYFSRFDQHLLRWGSWCAQWFPALVMPIIRKRIRAESAHVIISAEDRSFQEYLKQRERDGIRVNLNQLGEAVLGDSEADRRLEIYTRRLQEPGIRYVSVKLSSIVSHISLTGYETTLEETKQRLRILYRAAIAAGNGQHRFVNLDMEEYRDLHLTVDVFQSVLDEPEFQSLPAGIVLQAYLPDSFAVQQLLSKWAHSRVQRGGADIKIRLVKGANLAMEQVEASLCGWPQAPYHTKVESDANFKRMVDFALRPENSDAVRVGIASHNLFDIAYALLLAQKHGVTRRVDFEMLEGMANSQAQEIREKTGDLLVYAPVCYDADFDSAVAYLVRRFDENTQPGSFLSSLFGLTVHSPEWEQQSQMFLQACALAKDPQLSNTPQRTQNRESEQTSPSAADQAFRNVSNTDFSIPENRVWIRNVVQRLRNTEFGTIPVQVHGHEQETDARCPGRDPSRPDTYCMSIVWPAASMSSRRCKRLPKPKRIGKGVAWRHVPRSFDDSPRLAPTSGAIRSA